MIINKPEEILEHHGVKGMRWGVRKVKTLNTTQNRKKVINGLVTAYGAYSIAQLVAGSSRNRHVGYSTIRSNTSLMNAVYSNGAFKVTAV